MELSKLILTLLILTGCASMPDKPVRDEAPPLAPPNINPGNCTGSQCAELGKPCSLDPFADIADPPQVVDKSIICRQNTTCVGGTQINSEWGVCVHNKDLPDREPLATEPSAVDKD